MEKKNTYSMFREKKSITYSLKKKKKLLQLCQVEWGMGAG